MDEQADDETSVVSVTLVDVHNDSRPVVISLDRALTQLPGHGVAQVAFVVVTDGGRRRTLVVDPQWLETGDPAGPVPSDALLAVFPGDADTWTEERTSRAVWSDRGDGVLMLTAWPL